MRKLTQVICSLALIAAAFAANAVVPTPAPPQSEPIALVGAIIHVGDGTVIGDGVITFDEGVITAVGSAADGIDTSGHLVIDVQGSHIYPGLVLPNSTLGLLEIANIRATNDVVEEGDINASVRSAIAYNTDSELIPATRFNGILTAQVTPEGGLISGLSSIFMLDAWNWEDAALRLDDGQHMHWPGFKRNRRNPDTGRFERVDNDDYQAQVELLHALFRDAVSYTGEPLNLNLAAMQGLFDGSGKLFLHADGAREIISGVRFARSYGVQDIVLVGGAEALQVKDLLLTESIPVIYERIHALPGMEWHDVDAPFRMPFLLQEAGLEVGIGGGDTELTPAQSAVLCRHRRGLRFRPRSRSRPGDLEQRAHSRRRRPRRLARNRQGRNAVHFRRRRPRYAHQSGAGRLHPGPRHRPVRHPAGVVREIPREIFEPD